MISLQPISRRRTSLVIGILFCLTIALGGCQSPTVTHEQAQNVLESRITVRQQLVLTRAQLDATTTALNDINGKQADDLVLAFNKYGSQLDLLDASVADLAHASTVSKALAETYFETAAVKIALINDPELKSRATERRQKALGLAQSINENTLAVQDAYRLLLQRLRDIQAYLAADLTSGCVRSNQDQFALANQDVAPIKAKSDRLSFDVELGNELMNTGEVKPSTTTTTTQATTVEATTTDATTSTTTSTAAPLPSTVPLPATTPLPSTTTVP